jgi:hypothetical protein
MASYEAVTRQSKPYPYTEHQVPSSFVTADWKRSICEGNLLVVPQSKPTYDRLG